MMLPLKLNTIVHNALPLFISQLSYEIEAIAANLARKKFTF